MVDDKTRAKIEYDYISNKLYDSAKNCKSDTVEWLAATIVNNENASHKGEITRSDYLDRQRKIMDKISNFSHGCRCII